MVVLVVDDDPVTRLVVEHILRGGGYPVEVADSGEAAVELLLSISPVDLVVCDFQMPGMSGLDLFEQLAEGGSEAPFIMLTGVGEQTELDDERSTAIAGFLTKPVKSRDLLDAVAAHCRA